MVNSIEVKLKEMIVKHSKREITLEDIKPSSDLVSDFGYDSVLMIDLIVDIEAEFDIRVEDDDLDLAILIKYDTLSEFIAEKVKNK